MFVFVSWGAGHAPIIRIGPDGLDRWHCRTMPGLSMEHPMPLPRIACLPTVLLAALSFPAGAEEPAAAATVSAADPAIATRLGQLGYAYEVDGDGDYQLVMAVGDDGRSQLVFVRSPVETFGRHRIREVWSPAYLSATDAFPGPVANRLLEASGELKLGSWVKQGRHAVVVVKIDADADAGLLEQAISAAAASADEMEQELAGNPDSDGF